MPIPPLKKIPKTDYAVHHKHTRGEKEDIKKIVLILSAMIVVGIFLLVFVFTPSVPDPEDFGIEQSIERTQN